MTLSFQLHFFIIIIIIIILTRSLRTESVIAKDTKDNEQK